MIKIVITSGFRWSYFHWFILGFYMLEDEEEISVKFKVPLISKIMSSANIKNDKVNLGLRFLQSQTESDKYNLKGYIEYEKGECIEKKYFVIDSADSPFLFNASDLEECDVYFKMQCPKDLDKEGFSLTNEILIPWLDQNHPGTDKGNMTKKGKRTPCANFDKQKSKIVPLMIGPRKLTNGCFSKKKLLEGYNRYLSERNVKKTKNIMCYFGNSMGPNPSQNVIEPDYDWESDLLGYFGDKINHPNEKRAKVSEIIAQKENCDARIITVGHSDTGIKERKDLIIPIEDFCKHISQFQYNMNVSGYRLSIPNRFIESFIVGTGIITDKLSIKWYRDFEQEVIETVDMGYLQDADVDWEAFKKIIDNIPAIDSKCVVNEYENKWHPKVVAKYIINTLTSCNIR